MGERGGRVLSFTAREEERMGYIVRARSAREKFLKISCVGTAKKIKIKIKIGSVVKKKSLY